MSTRPGGSTDASAGSEDALGAAPLWRLGPQVRSRRFRLGVLTAIAAVLAALVAETKLHVSPSTLLSVLVFTALLVPLLSMLLASWGLLPDVAVEAVPARPADAPAATSSEGQPAAS